MSTIPIGTMLRSAALKSDRGFNSLFAAYASTQRRNCSKCSRKKSMITCQTLLENLIVTRRDLVIETFGLPKDAKLSVFLMGTAFGIQVR